MSRTAERIEALAAAASDRGLDALIVSGEADLAYFTGLRTTAFERLLALVVRADGDATLVVPRLEEPAVEALAVPARVAVWDLAPQAVELVAAAARGATRVGIDEERLSYGRATAVAETLGGVRLEPASGLVAAARASKDGDEVAAVRKAAAILQPAVVGAIAQARVDMTERELARLLAADLELAGSEHSHVIVLFGEHSAAPHGSQGDRPLRDGDIASIDATACVAGYNADVTRCATVGDPSDWAVACWQAVVDAHDAALDAVRPGVAAREVDAAARERQQRFAHAEVLHGVGHGLGLEIHEPPYLVPDGEQPLVEGMVITIEPALYHPEHGGLRLENTVLVAPGGAEVLSGSDRELRRIGPPPG